MRKRRLSSTAAALLMLHLQVACSVYQPSHFSSIAPGSDVRVRFPSPAPVVIGYEETDSIRHFQIPQARAVEGKFVGTTGDTMRMRPVWSLNAPQIGSDGAFPSASFIVSDATSVAVRQISPERTLLLVLGISAAVVATVAIAAASISLDGFGWGATSGW